MTATTRNFATIYRPISAAAGDPQPDTGRFRNARKIASEWSKTHPNPLAPHPKWRKK